MAGMWFTCRMSAIPRYLLVAAVLCGLIGTGTYINDIWISGDGVLAAPSGLAGTCLGIGLVLAGVGLNLVMRDELRARRK